MREAIAAGRESIAQHTDPLAQLRTIARLHLDRMSRDRDLAVVFQVELRRRFAGTPLLVLGVTNRTIGYLSPGETYGTGLYQEQQSPFAPGCLEQTIEVAGTALEELLAR